MYVQWYLRGIFFSTQNLELFFSYKIRFTRFLTKCCNMNDRQSFDEINYLLPLQMHSQLLEWDLYKKNILYFTITLIFMIYIICRQKSM